MRGDVVFRVYGVSSDRTDDVYLGTFRTCAEAEAEIVTLSAREVHGENWARCYHDRGFVIRETVVETDFEIPSLPKPRDAWAVRTSEISNGEGVMASTAVEVCRRGAHGLEPAASYVRNLALCRTFEPFRQGDRELADLVAKKRRAKEGAGMSRLTRSAPAAALMLERAAQRGQNIGGLVAKLLELLDLYGAARLEEALTEANAHERVGASPVRVALQTLIRAQGRTVPRPVKLTDPRLRDIVVESADLSLYDALTEDDDGEAS